MGATPGRETTALNWNFPRPPEAFTFEQLMRCLCLRWQDSYGGRDAFLSRGVKVVPLLSLSFPPTDIASFSMRLPERLPGPQIRRDAAGEDAELPFFTVTATFLGLYGASAPLPSFYTEDLLGDEREDLSVTRDFLDIINQTLYRKYYLAGNLCKVAFRTLESREPDIANLQYCLLGLGHDPLRRSLGITFRDLAHIGLFAHHAKSAAGLEQYLSVLLGLSGSACLPSLEVEQCVERRVPVPEDQRCLLGRSNAALGEDAVLGREVRDASGTFRLHFSEVDGDLFRDLEAGRPKRELL